MWGLIRIASVALMMISAALSAESPPGRGPASIDHAAKPPATPKASAEDFSFLVPTRLSRGTGLSASCLGVQVHNRHRMAQSGDLRAPAAMEMKGKNTESSLTPWVSMWELNRAGKSPTPQPTPRPAPSDNRILRVTPLKETFECAIQVPSPCLGDEAFVNGGKPFVYRATYSANEGLVRDSAYLPAGENMFQFTAAVNPLIARQGRETVEDTALILARGHECARLAENHAVLPVCPSGTRSRSYWVTDAPRASWVARTEVFRPSEGLWIGVAVPAYQRLPGLEFTPGIPLVAEYKGRVCLAGQVSANQRRSSQEAAWMPISLLHAWTDQMIALFGVR